MSFTYAQKASLALIPKVTGLLSALGSLWIVLDILGDKAKQRKLYHRLVFGLSFVDVFTSFFFCLATWPVPRGTPGIIWASGNELSCRLQGFVLQLACTAFIYNAVLTIYFVLVIRFSMKEATLKGYEPLFHALPLGFGLSTSTFCLVRGYFNNANTWCWIAGFEDAYIYRWAFFFGPLWCCFLVVLIGMVFMLWGVLLQERQISRFDAYRNFRKSVEGSSGSAPVATNVGESETMLADGTLDTSRGSAVVETLPGRKTYQRTRQVAVQATLFVLAFYLTYFFATVTRIYQQLNPEKPTPFVLLVLHVVFLPLQGTFNFIIYRRSMMIRLWRRYPNMSWLEVIWMSLKLPVLMRKASRQESTSFKTGSSAPHRQQHQRQDPYGIVEDDQGPEEPLEQITNGLSQTMPSYVDPLSQASREV